jgi:hypothetical protein
MTLTFGLTAGSAEAVFNGHFWRLVSPPPTSPTVLDGATPVVRLHGRMAVWRKDVAVFRADDGRNFTFGPIGYGCA